MWAILLAAVSVTCQKSLGIAFWNSDQLPTIRIRCSLNEWNSLLRDFDANPLTELYRRCDNLIYELQSDKAEFRNVGLRVKGSVFGRMRPENGEKGSTHNASALTRGQFVVKLDETFKDDESVYGSPDVPTLLSNKDRNFNGIQKLVFRYGNRDPSLTKSVLVSDIRNEFNTRAVRYSFTRLYITIGNDPEKYYGVYQIEESIEDDFYKRRGISTKQAFVYKCLWKEEQAKLQISHALDPQRYIGKEQSDPSNPEEVDSFKPFSPIYDIKDGNEEIAITTLAQFMMYLNQSKTKKPSLVEIRSKFKIGNILRGIALDAFLIDYDSTWFYGNNYYLYMKDDEWDIFRYDYDTALRGVATKELAITDQQPLKPICPLQGNGNYTFRLNTSSLTFTLKTIKQLPKQQQTTSRPNLSSSSSVVRLIGQNGTNITLIQQGNSNIWQAQFQMNDCFFVQLPQQKQQQKQNQSSSSLLMGLRQYSGLLSVPFLQFNRADVNAPYTPHAIIDLLLSYPALKQEYLGYVYELSQNLLHPKNVMPRLQKYLDLIRDAAAPSLLQVEAQPSLEFSTDVSDISTILTERQRQFAIERPNFKTTAPTPKGK